MGPRRIGERKPQGSTTIAIFAAITAFSMYHFLGDDGPKYEAGDRITSLNGLEEGQCFRQVTGGEPAAAGTTVYRYNSKTYISQDGEVTDTSSPNAIIPHEVTQITDGQNQQNQYLVEDEQVPSLSKMLPEGWSFGLNIFPESSLGIPGTDTSYAEVVDCP